MPSQRPLSRYPTEYKYLLLRAARLGVVKIPTPSAQAAEHLRKELYNYRQALREETPLPPTELDHRALVAADELKFVVYENILIIRRFESVYTPLVRAALKETTHDH